MRDERVDAGRVEDGRIEDFALLNLRPQRNCRAPDQHQLVSACLLELRSDRREHHHRSVACIPQITSSGVRDPGRLIVARKVIAHLDLALHNTDDGEPHSSHCNGFPDRRTSAEQLHTKTTAEEYHSAPLHFIRGIDPASFRRHFVAHLAIFRAHAANCRRSDHAVTIGDSGAANRLKARVFHQRRGRLHHVNVSLFELNFLPGALSAWLFAGLLRPANDHALAERIESAHQNGAKATAIRDQQRDGRNSPHNAEHSQERASVVALQRDPGFENDFRKHVRSLKPECRRGTRLTSAF